MIERSYLASTAHDSKVVEDGFSIRNSFENELPDHLVKIPGEQWAVWKWVCLRAAGFGSHLVSQLAAGPCAAAADRLLALEKEVAEIRQGTIAAFRSALAGATDEQRRKDIHRGLKQLNKGRVPDSIDDPGLELCRHKFLDTCQKAEEAGNSFRHEFQAGIADVSVKIRNITDDSWLRQAMLLQNRSAFRRVAKSFMRRETGQAKRGFKERQNDELIANYLQRYCLKNDTIGFFGPVGWARVIRQPMGFNVLPGERLIAKSSVHFENWCIEALASKIAEDKSLRPWMPPRLLPYFCVEGNILHAPGGISTVLSSLHAEVLHRCNGMKTAREIALEILASGRARTESQIYGVLQVFESRGIVSWTFEIPICLHPEQKLLELLNRIEKQELRRPLIEQVCALDEARENISRAFGDADQLERALENLDRIFTELTGKASSKSAGAMYASRTLIYQDCQRDLEVEIGPDILAALGLPLSLLLNGARWFTWRAAALYREAFAQVYSELAQSNDHVPVDLMQFWARIEPLIFDPNRRVFNQVISEFQERWEQILSVPQDEKRVQYTAADLKPRTQELFAAPKAGWSFARYHSPDVMIAASSVEAIRRGDYHFVLGEVHMAGNTVRFSFAVSQHPCREELFESIQRDLPFPRIVPVPPRQWPRTTNRTAIALRSPEDYLLEVSRDSVANAPRTQAIPISAMIVEPSGGGLMVCTRDHSLQFEVIEFMGEVLSGAAVELMKIMRPRKHTPRVSIDQLVIFRESWSFSGTEITFINLEDEHQRYFEARRWMHEHQLPRFVFIKVPVEVKPFFVDFDSPIYVEILVKMVRRLLASDRATENISFTEMLPDPNHLWLPDSQGHHYTSELRMVMRDQMG